MVAAFLPLPIRSSTSRGNSADDLEKGHGIESDFARQFGHLDEARYESAKWWRNLNRCMSVVGMIIIIIVVCFLPLYNLPAFEAYTVQIVLVVMGTKHRW